MIHKSILSNYHYYDWKDQTPLVGDVCITFYWGFDNPIEVIITEVNENSRCESGYLVLIKTTASIRVPQYVDANWVILKDEWNTYRDEQLQNQDEQEITPYITTTEITSCYDCLFYSEGSELCSKTFWIRANFKNVPINCPLRIYNVLVKIKE